MPTWSRFIRKGYKVKKIGQTLHNRYSFRVVRCASTRVAVITCVFIDLRKVESASASASGLLSVWEGGRRAPFVRQYYIKPTMALQHNTSLNVIYCPLLGSYNW